MKDQTTTDRIDTLADLAASQIRNLILEARDSITESVNAALEEAQESEDGKAMLRLYQKCKTQQNKFDD